MTKDEAIAYYESALKEAFPTGATGDVFHYWNEARKALAEQPAQQRHISYVCPQCYWSLDEQPAQRKPLTDNQIEKLREKTFSTGNPYCPVDSKSMRKAARAIEAAHGIKGDA